MIYNLDKPRNQYAQAVLLLIEKGASGVTMADACKDFFYKFCTRLGEVEHGRHDKIKVIRLKETSINRFGHPVTYTRYKSIADVHYLIGLYKKLNENGLVSKKATA